MLTGLCVPHQPFDRLYNLFIHLPVLRRKKTTGQAHLYSHSNACMELRVHPFQDLLIVYQPSLGTTALFQQCSVCLPCRSDISQPTLRLVSAKEALVNGTSILKIGFVERLEEIQIVPKTNVLLIKMHRRFDTDEIKINSCRVPT